MIVSNLSFGENVSIHPSTSVNNVHFGNNVKVAKGCTIHGGAQHVVKIGSGAILAMYLTVEGTLADIELGDQVSIGQHSVIVSDWGLAPGSAVNKLFAQASAPIKIGDHSWIGSGCVIAPGVTIGKFSVVASNSYVDADVPDYSIYGGNPARFIRAIDPKEVLIEKIGE
jgi:acetyltransferase-like isoleucine patch superfamily enzyme